MATATGLRGAMAACLVGASETRLIGETPLERETSLIRATSHPKASDGRVQGLQGQELQVQELQVQPRDGRSNEYSRAPRSSHQGHSRPGCSWRTLKHRSRCKSVCKPSKHLFLQRLRPIRNSQTKTTTTTMPRGKATTKVQHTKQ